ncbi:MAG: hypothetical protein BGO49_11130 [Planctomycetales bacterium 71-10]|nr:MAG: hypothetical protein BGO49_11130 [Planctomycetales bacterium 71-10]
MPRKAGKGRTVAVLGLGKVDRRLKRLAPDLQARYAAQAMEAGMSLVLQAAKANAPVDTGELRDAIHMETHSDGSRVSVEVKVGEGDFLGDQYYAAMVEYGTYKMAAHPYMLPAYEDQGPRARALTLRILLAGLRRLANRG